MSVANLCLGLYLLFIGCVQLFGLSVSNTLLGVLALIAGILILVGDLVPSIGRRHS